MARARTPWSKFFLDYDPAPTIQKVKCPVLAVFGERDLQAPIALNRDPMEQALKKEFVPELLPLVSSWILKQGQPTGR